MKRIRKLSMMKNVWFNLFKFKRDYRANGATLLNKKMLEIGAVLKAAFLMQLTGQVSSTRNVMVRERRKVINADRDALC